MSELKKCPFCAKPARDLGDGHCQCSGSNCISGNFKMTYTAWNTRPSLWIKITPETMPEVGQRVPVVIAGILYTGKVVDHPSAGMSWSVDGWISVFDLHGTYLGVGTCVDILSHYYPVILPKDGEL
jgi:hypothetical protein